MTNNLNFTIPYISNQYYQNIMKKILFCTFLCFSFGSLWAGNNDSIANPNSTNITPHSPTTLTTSTIFNKSQLANSFRRHEFIIDEAEAVSYIFAPRYQLSAHGMFWEDFFYAGFDMGFNLDRNKYVSSRSTQQDFNPFCFQTTSLGFKLGPIMLGLNAGLTWDAADGHWLYTVGFFPGLIASAVGKIIEPSRGFFDGLYFMWGAEAHLQLSKLILSGGYHFFPNIDMNHWYLGIGVVID